MSDWGDQSASMSDDDMSPADSPSNPSDSSPLSLPRLSASRTSSRSFHGSKPKRVGNYLIGATLGKGSFGVVKLGTHVETGAEYALKFLSKKQVTDIFEVERLFRESAILTPLKCDNVIRLYEVIDEPNHIVMVMELARGGDLLDLIKSRLALPEREACRLFAEVVAGVEYCHKKNIVHRDLKLENVLMVNGKVKIADFGLSNTGILGKSEMGTACGTPSYLAPEQISRESGSYIGPQADIWAMGVILYAMVAGFLPFQAKSTPALFKKILNLEFGFPDYFSEELQDLVRRMLTPEPDNRATIAEIKSHPWYMMDLNDLAESCERQVTEEMVRQAREKLMERSSPSAKSISRKPSESNRSTSSASTTLNARASKPNSPQKRLDSSGLPPVPNTGKSHSRTPSSTHPPRLSRGGSNTSMNGSGTGQFRMRPANQRLNSVDVKAMGLTRVHKSANEVEMEDESDDVPKPVLGVDRTRPLPKLTLKKSISEDIDANPKLVE